MTRTANIIVYTLTPISDQPLTVGEVLHVLPGWRRPLVWLRRPGEIDACAVVQGDGAIDIQQRRVERLLVEEVGELSGCGQAVEVVE